uniref:Phosphoenolpyruvate phosphomutase family protein n=1 Tax=Rhizobium rhizogenes TaxID=359 RepID=A0A7S4ZRW0_RHIRH|nr:isocitrate lyase/phosphoenolpyruvate mutase family protein [Rhizobium rhizogenes]QCL09171.1 phosphoenolpyruvate phosphomutase family protein [Rhizobium rhizogenes]QCL09807.1 phosphoenolpyruvate phosphomutase family protein [Rhizobium rhizogenes]
MAEIGPEQARDVGAIFRLLHEGPTPFIIPNPWDAGTARILAAMGFPALATTSAGMAFSLGVADGGVSREDALEHCRRIVAATTLPVSADLENGFGDSPERVADTLREAAKTGLAGCSLEDYTSHPENPIYDFSLAEERIAAAVEAKKALPHDFILTARCENFLRGRPNVGDTIKRLQAFERAGADVLYAPGLHDLDVIREICQAISKPVNVVMGMPGVTFGLAELAEAGVKRVSVGSALARLAFGAFVEAAREMKSDGTFQFANQTVSFAEIQRFFAAGARI